MVDDATSRVDCETEFRRVVNLAVVAIAVARKSSRKLTPTITGRDANRCGAFASIPDKLFTPLDRSRDRFEFERPRERRLSANESRWKTRMLRISRYIR